jgi:hypothetical protein
MIVFLDESGNLDFSHKGTRHFVLTAVVSYEPNKTVETIERMKCRLLERGLNSEYFHATEDLQLLRDEMFRNIAKMRDNFRVFYSYAKKSKLSDRTPAQVFAMLAAELIRGVAGYTGNSKPLCLVFDRTLTKKEEKVFRAKIKPMLKATGRPFHIYFHRTMSDYNAQIADYCSWAKYVSLERKENRPMESLSGLSITEYQIRG